MFAVQLMGAGVILGKACQGNGPACKVRGWGSSCSFTPAVLEGARTQDIFDKLAASDLQGKRLMCFTLQS